MADAPFAAAGRRRRWPATPPKGPRRHQAGLRLARPFPGAPRRRDRERARQRRRGPGTQPPVGSFLCATAAFEVNDNLTLYVTHVQMLSDRRGRPDLQGALTRVTLAWSWHSVLEKIRGLQE